MTGRDTGAPRIVLSLEDSRWNRAGLDRLTYGRALRRSGARIRRVGVGQRPLESEAERARELLGEADGLVLTGGSDVDPERYGATRGRRRLRPLRDRFELALLAEADARGLPVLGICRGAQLLNVYHGGTLRQLGESAQRHRWLARHHVLVEPGSLARTVFSSIAVESVASHHANVVAEPGRDVRVSGRAEDGAAEIVEVPPARGTAWKLGVQWHAEWMPLSDQQRRLFDWFCREAAAWRRGAQTVGSGWTLTGSRV